MPARRADISLLYDGLSFVSRQSRELGEQLHPGLPLVAHSLLAFVRDETNPRAVDVAAAFGLDKSTVSRQIGSLEAAGLIARGGELPGRRGQVLTLTKAGRAALREAAESSRRTLAEHLSDWEDADVASLARLLARFAQTSRRARHDHVEPR